MGHTILIADLLGLAILLFGFYIFVRPTLTGAVYFPTSTRTVERIMRLAEIKPGEKIVDIGSGDGRIVIAAAERGATAVGYEVNPFLVIRSRRAIRRAHLENSAKIYWKSFWKADLAPFDTIIVYGIPYIMNRLRKKLECEARPGTKIISNSFPFPQWKPKIKEEGVYVYLSKSLH